MRHLWLRRYFCSIYVTTANEVIDVHKNWMEGAGVSEQALFVQQLLWPDGIAQVPSGSRVTKKRGETAETFRETKINAETTAACGLFHGRGLFPGSRDAFVGLSVHGPGLSS